MDDTDDTLPRPTSSENDEYGRMNREGSFAGSIDARKRLTRKIIAMNGIHRVNVGRTGGVGGRG